VSVSSASGINVYTIADLSSVCAQLKQQVGLPGITNMLECRMGTDNVLSTNESPDKSIFSLQSNGIWGTNAAGQGFSLEGWSRLEPPKGRVAAIDFISPHASFVKFRVLTFPPGATNQPFTFPKSLLRANQSGWPASLENSLAARIGKFELKEGFLQLRPFITANGSVKDMIDAMPSEAKSAVAYGNEINFDMIRKLLNDQIKKAGDETNKLQQEITDLNSQLDGLSTQIKSQQEAFKKSPDDPTKSDALTESQRKLSEIESKLNRAKPPQALLNKKLAEDRMVLEHVPTGLDDPKLDHVGLFFIAGSPIKPGEKFELIRFADATGALEERK
jgi:hypothetical protein